VDAQTLIDHAKALKATGVIKATAYTVARQLIDRASDQWTVMLTREEACELCGVTNWASARRSLKRLEEVGFIGLHTNMRAYVYFLEPAAALPASAESARERAETARAEADDLTEPRQNCAPARTNGAIRAETARQRAVLDSLPRDQGSPRDWERDIPIPIPSEVLEGGAGETDPDAPEVRDSAQFRPNGAEQARAVALLTDDEVGLSPYMAIQAATRYSFAEIRRAVFRYLRDRADGKADSPGCLPYRLANPKRFPATISEADRASALWVRHADADDYDAEAEERRRKYDPQFWAQE
jgi:hypothetical protein